MKRPRNIVKGRGLKDLFDAFQSLSVEWVREYTQRYLALAKGTCFVERIESVEPED